MINLIGLKQEIIGKRVIPWYNRKNSIPREGTMRRKNEKTYIRFNGFIAR